MIPHTLVGGGEVRRRSKKKEKMHSSWPHHVSLSLLPSLFSMLLNAAAVSVNFLFTQREVSAPFAMVQEITCEG